jgi:hypothetical protein
MLGSSSMIGQVYFNAKNFSLLSEKYFWMGSHYPQAENELTLNVTFGRDAYKDLIGFTYLIDSTQDSNLNVNLNKLGAIWNNLASLDSSRFIPLGYLVGATAYECTMSLLYGLDRYFKTNNGSFSKRPSLSPSDFSNTSYLNLYSQPYDFYPDGDQKT